MNYYAPRQVDPKSDRPDAGKWRYTVMNDGRVHEVGLCSPWELCPTCGEEPPYRMKDCATCGGKGLVEKAEPCPGHDTADEACEHYRQGMLDKINFLFATLTDTRHRCDAGACNEFTANITVVGPHYDLTYHLCETHRTREAVEALVPRVGNIVSSY